MVQTFNTKVAQALGLESAVILSAMNTMRLMSEHVPILNKYGKTWIYLGKEVLESTFPYLSLRVAKSRLNGLEGAGYIAQHEDAMGDWYCMTPAGIELFGEGSLVINKEKSEKAVKNSGANLELPFNTPAFAEGWAALLKEKKWKAKSESALKKSLEKLKGWGERKALVAMDIAIERGWQGIFEPSQRDMEEYNKRHAPAAPAMAQRVGRKPWEDMGVSEEQYKLIMGK